MILAARSLTSGIRIRILAVDNKIDSHVSYLASLKKKWTKWGLIPRLLRNLA